MKSIFLVNHKSMMGMLLVMLWSTALYSACMPINWDELYERSDVVFAAEMSFSHMDFIADSNNSRLYRKKDFYHYRTMHVWKGEPGAEGIAYPGSSDHITYYEFPVFSDGDLTHAEHKSSQPPSTLIVYGNQTKHGLVYGGCVTMPKYQHAFSLRLELAKPAKSYHDFSYAPLSPAEIFDYLEHTMTLGDESLMMGYDALEDAMVALNLMQQQDAMLDFLQNEKFMRCQQPWASLSVMSNLIRNLPEYAQPLHDKFRFMFSCSEQASRINIFTALSNIVSSAELFKMIRHAMLDPSIRLRKNAAASVSRLDDIDLVWFLDQATELLASRDPLERMFAAVMLVGITDIDPHLIIAVCQAEPARWKFNKNPDYFESVADQCHQLRSRLPQHQAVPESDSRSSGRVVLSNSKQR